MYAAIYAGVAIAGGLSATAGHITIGQLSSFLSYTNQYTKPFNDITSVLTEFQNAIASADRSSPCSMSRPPRPNRRMPSCCSTLPARPDGAGWIFPTRRNRP